MGELPSEEVAKLESEAARTITKLKEEVLGPLVLKVVRPKHLGIIDIGGSFSGLVVEVEVL